MNYDWILRQCNSASQFILGSVGLATFTFICFELNTGLPTAAFAYLILIALLSLMGSYVVSIILSIAAVACLNYFFAPPIFSFRADYPQDAIAAAAFATTSIVIGGLTKMIRKIALERQALAEQALRQSEEQWREVFEHSPVMHFMVGPDGTVLSVNPSGASKLGYTIAELTGLPVLKVFTEEDQEAATRNIEACLAIPGIENRWEIRKVRKDGKVIWVRESAKAVCQGSKGTIALIACEDIDESKRSDQRLAAQHGVTLALAESPSLAAAAQHLLQAIGGNLEWDWGALWCVDQQGALLRCTDTWSAPNVQSAEFDAASRESALAYGRSWVGRVWQSALPAWMSDASSEPGFVRAPAAAKAGLKSAVAFPILLGGQALGIVEFFSRVQRQRDTEQLETLLAMGSQIGQFITRKRAEEAALKESESRFRALIERAYDAVLLLDAQGIIHYANLATTRLSGFSSEELINSNAFDMLHPDDLQNSIRLFNAILQQEDSVTIGEPRRLRHKNGSWRWAEGVARNWLHDPMVKAVVVVLRDITERKETEQALRDARAELARVARITTLGELTASIGHEINQPLAAIVTAASAGLRWLGTASPDLAEARQSLTRIVRDGNRAAEVIGRIRALAVRSPIRTDQVKMNEIIREVIVLTKSEIDRNRITLVTKLAEDLPAIEGDGVQLQQVILNLITNAIEAMNGDGPRDLLIISKKDAPQKVLVSVSDTGPGLDPGSADRIFEAFYTTKPGGMGIGLSICRSIMEAHGGWLTASPNSPRGTTFQFAIPAAGLDSQAAAS